MQHNTKLQTKLYNILVKTYPIMASLSNYFIIIIILFFLKRALEITENSLGPASGPTFVGRSNTCQKCPAHRPDLNPVTVILFLCRKKRR